MISEIKKHVGVNFLNFGINKKREITRLIYEIAKREKISPLRVIKELEGANYSGIKQELLARRYPEATLANVAVKAYLPELSIEPAEKAVVEKRINLYPRRVFIEEKAENDYLSLRIKELFPKAEFIRIDSLKNYSRNKRFGLVEYNRRSENFFIIRENYDFFKKCPCTKGAVSCGYSVFNLGLGCVYECVYCYLQGYLNNPGGIIIPSNIEDYFRRFKMINLKKGFFGFSRIGSGEFADSLALDEITEFSPLIVEFFRKIPKVYFEFKTKSKNVANILKLKPSENIIISWSLNTAKIIKENEFYTALLKERISSAESCVRLGFKVGFHFDPVIYYRGWETDYKNLVNYLFDKIPARAIAWISLGTLRFNPALKKIIENRFPRNKILDEELLLGFDDKLRYPPYLRIMVYKKMLNWIRKRAPHICVYLCMEEKKITEEINGN